MKKTIAFTLVLMCLMAVSIVCVRQVKAQYQGIITINANGSVTPSTAPVKHVGDTYTLTNSVTVTASNMGGTITVLRNNTILDGSGYSVGELSVNNVSNVTVKNFIATNYAYNSQAFSFNGITLNNSSNIIVANNTVTGALAVYEFDGSSYAGIYVDGGGSNIFTGNNIANNEYGIYFSETENNLIIGNSITDSVSQGLAACGIMFWEASNNTVYHNNFMVNAAGAIQAADGNFFPGHESPNSINVWDDGYPGGGNYWSDYKGNYPNATEIDASGIGNTAYVIDAQNKDRYPLMAPFNSTFFALEVTAPRISIESPINRAYNGSSIPLVFSIDVFSADKAVYWTGYSCDRRQNVTVTSNTTLTGLSSGLHSIVVYANDTFGNMGVSETVNFTVAVPQPFPTTTVAAASGVSAVVVVVACLLVYFKKHNANHDVSSASSS